MSGLRKVRKRPVELEAIQWTGHASVVEMLRLVAERDTAGCKLFYDPPVDGSRWGSLSALTLESERYYPRPFDWLVFGVGGELYFCKPALFEVLYENLGEYVHDPYPRSSEYRGE